jgi:4'-phosphopantetheinyl transferase
VAIYFQADTPEGGRIAIWHVTESLEELKATLGEHAPGFSEMPPEHRKRRQPEWYATRLLIALLGHDPHIVYNNLGKPQLTDKKAHISISHSGSYVAAAVHPTKRTGIDIELTGDRILKVKDKFLGNNEVAILKNEMEAECLYVIWGSKECAFKIYGKGSVDFREHLHVKPFEFGTKGKTSVKLQKPEENEEYDVEWEYFGNLMLVSALER